MLRLIIQTKRKYKSKKEPGEKTFVTTKEARRQEEDSTHDEYNQDGSISFDDDDDSTARQEDDPEDWIEYKKEARKKLTKKC